MEEQKNNIIKKLVFRLVRKRIAGSTSGAVLNVVRDLNSRGFHATVTFLNDHVEDQTKARYNTNSYTQSIRQLSRLHLDSSVSVRLGQIGYGIDNAVMEKNLRDILTVANSYRQRLWLESETYPNRYGVMDVYRRFRAHCNTLGVEVRPDYTSGNAASRIARGLSSRDMVKLVAPVEEKEGAKARRKEKISKFKIYKEYVDALMDRKVNLTILENDPVLINRIIASGKDYKRNLIFEIPLGYSAKKLNALQKSKLNLSVYVPYGKDWVPYLINRLAEGRVRNIAVALLNGERSNIGSNVENEGSKAG
ncbi:MAG: hypothetical protein KGI06_04260 [Candidatus Micrarchaeota archaeon]|nr:hypothetical protein [Candidatus Micrarchaeota archaeon]